MTRLTLLAVVAVALPGAVEAQETSAEMQVATTAGYSNNPFAEVGNDTGSGFVALDLTPQIRVLTERSAFTVSGMAHIEDYVSRYPVTDSYRGSIDYRGRPSQRLTVFGHVDVSSAVLGADDQYAIGSLSGLGETTGTTTIGTTGNTGTTGTTGVVGTGTTGTVAPPTSSTGPLISDIGLLGTRDRRKSIYATVGGDEALSAYSTLSLTGFADIARYSAFGDFSNYNGYGGTLGYSRRLSATLSIGVQGSGSWYDYPSAEGSTTIYSAQATASVQFSQFWSAQAALGVSFVSADAAGSGDRASPSGNINVCRQATYSSLCFQASRQARATGFNGVQYVTSAGANWTRRLTERSRLALDASYVQEGGLANRNIAQEGDAPARFNGLQDQYLRVSATYDRQLRQRLRLLVSARYRDIFGGIAGEAADFGGQVGLSYRLGDLR